MVKNDYRRALIMLRVHERGYSGHIRLEHRTLSGSMYFMVGAPSNANVLCAALVRRDSRGAYFAVKLGELRRDSRGQATLAYSFDPRNIDGRPLDEYLVAAVVERRQDGCVLALSGNVNGAREVSWPEVSAAACSVCRIPGEIEPRTQTGENSQTLEPGEPAADLNEAEEMVQEERKPASSAIDFTARWPAAAEALRPLFEARSEAENAPDDGLFYIEAPMPADSGTDFVYVGLRTEDGIPTVVAYAFPEPDSEKAAEELEEFESVGSWRVIYLDAERGEPLN